MRRLEFLNTSITTTLLQDQTQERLYRLQKPQMIRKTYKKHKFLARNQFDFMILS